MTGKQNLKYLNYDSWMPKIGVLNLRTVTENKLALKSLWWINQFHKLCQIKFIKKGFKILQADITDTGLSNNNVKA